LKRFSERDHVHLIKLLVTFSWREQFYLLFPWADGNLLDFWQMFPQPSSPERDRNMAVWFSEQCLGIVQGLEMIHMADSPSTEDLTKVSGHQLHGRHGDLKPENILWFKPYQDTHRNHFGVLKISDFGLTRFHRTRSKSHFESVAVSRTYRPPEYDIVKMVSQSYDIWTLGCVLLEFVTWYLYGWEVTIAHCKTYWFSESIQSKVLSEASTTLKVMALQST
jgi:serine/threonine protein kinase